MVGRTDVVNCGLSLLCAIVAYRASDVSYSDTRTYGGGALEVWFVSLTFAGADSVVFAVGREAGAVDPLFKLRDSGAGEDRPGLPGKDEARFSGERVAFFVLSGVSGVRILRSFLKAARIVGCCKRGAASGSWWEMQMESKDSQVRHRTRKGAALLEG